MENTGLDDIFRARRALFHPVEAVVLPLKFLHEKAGMVISDLVSVPQGQEPELRSPPPHPQGSGCPGAAAAAGTTAGPSGSHRSVLVTFFASLQANTTITLSTKQCLTLKKKRKKNFFDCFETSG